MAPKKTLSNTSIFAIRSVDGSITCPQGQFEKGGKCQTCSTCPAGETIKYPCQQKPPADTVCTTKPVKPSDCKTGYYFYKDKATQKGMCKQCRVCASPFIYKTHCTQTADATCSGPPPPPPPGGISPLAILIIILLIFAGFYFFVIKKQT